MTDIPLCNAKFFLHIEYMFGIMDLQRTNVCCAQARRAGADPGKGSSVRACEPGSVGQRVWVRECGSESVGQRVWVRECESGAVSPELHTGDLI